MSVISGRMAQLQCMVQNGVFSHERLVHFEDASGIKQAALVDSKHLNLEGESYWLTVKPVNDDSDRVRIALPTADADRVWVRAEALRSPVAA